MSSASTSAANVQIVSPKVASIIDPPSTTIVAGVGVRRLKSATSGKKYYFGGSSRASSASNARIKMRASSAKAAYESEETRRLLNKIMEMRKQIEDLQNELNIEREQLERVRRWQSISYQHSPSSTSQLIPTSPYLPPLFSNSFYAVSDNWTNNPVYQNINYFNHSAMVSHMLAPNYREHIRDLEKLCSSELEKNVQGLKNIRKIKYDWQEDNFARGDNFRTVDVSNCSASEVIQ